MKLQNIFEIDYDTTDTVKLIYSHLVENHKGIDQIETSKNIADSVNRLYGLNITSSIILKCVKIIRETGLPRFPYTIKSIAGKGYYVLTSDDTNKHSANIKQFIGLAKSIMKSGEYKKGFLHQILNDLETENLSYGQINTSNHIYKGMIQRG